ncbi:hypothetical protein BH23CHL8_BH23CHL8_30840 [soil metagenome]
MIRWDGEIQAAEAPPRDADGKLPRFVRWVGKVAARPETRCAWCGDRMNRARFCTSPQKSHGMCAPCATAWQRYLQQSGPPR